MGRCGGLRLGDECCVVWCGKWLPLLAFDCFFFLSYLCALRERVPHCVLNQQNETFLHARKSFAMDSTPPMCFLIMFLFQFPFLIRLLASLYVASVLLMCERGVCVHVSASPCPLFMSSLFVASARVSMLCLCVRLPCALRLFFFFFFLTSDSAVQHACSYDVDYVLLSCLNGCCVEAGRCLLPFPSLSALPKFMRLRAYVHPLSWMEYLSLPQLSPFLSFSAVQRGTVSRVHIRCVCVCVYVCCAHFCRAHRAPCPFPFSGCAAASFSLPLCLFFFLFFQLHRGWPAAVAARPLSSLVSAVRGRLPQRRRDWAAML